MANEAMQGVPDPRVCEQARLSRDPRFDGLFFTAVTSTGIYCRPVCPVPSPKRAHVRYYPSAAAAEAAGFRPCMRCRPELAPGAWRRGDALVARALKLIDEGFLAERPVTELAARIGVSERQLRRLFIRHLGVPPLRVYGTRRLLFAKQLLTETGLPITRIALEAGFGSLRRFNASFRQAYRMAPREMRRKPRRTGEQTLSLCLAYRPPLDFQAQLEFLSAHVVPGVERVDRTGYSRVIGPPESPGWLRLARLPGDRHALGLELYCRQPVRIQKVVTRLRRMFDLDAEPQVIDAALAEDPLLRPLLERHPGGRLPGAWSGLESVVLAVLERHAGLEHARGLAGRLAERYGQRLQTPFAPGLERLFPTPDTLARADLRAAGVPADPDRVIRGISRALTQGRVDFRPEQSLAEFLERWRALPGIDDHTAQRLAMHALGHPDAFPADEREFRDRARRWRPWRGYALACLRRDEGERIQGGNHFDRRAS